MCLLLDTQWSNHTSYERDHHNTYGSKLLLHVVLHVYLYFSRCLVFSVLFVKVSTGASCRACSFSTTLAFFRINLVLVFLPVFLVFVLLFGAYHFFHVLKAYLWYVRSNQLLLIPVINMSSPSSSDTVLPV